MRGSLQQRQNKRVHILFLSVFSGGNKQMFSSFLFFLQPVDRVPTKFQAHPRTRLNLKRLSLTSPAVQWPPQVQRAVSKAGDTRLCDFFLFFWWSQAKDNHHERNLTISCVVVLQPNRACNKIVTASEIWDVDLTV